MDEQTGRLIIVGSNLRGPLEELGRPFQVTLHESGTGVEEMRLKRIRIEQQATLELGIRLIVATRDGEGDTARGMRLGQIII